MKLVRREDECRYDDDCTLTYWASYYLRQLSCHKSRPRSCKSWFTNSKPRHHYTRTHTNLMETLLTEATPTPMQTLRKRHWRLMELRTPIPGFMETTQTTKLALWKLQKIVNSNFMTDTLISWHTHIALYIVRTRSQLRTCVTLGYLTHAQLERISLSYLTY